MQPITCGRVIMVALNSGWGGGQKVSVVGGIVSSKGEIFKLNATKDGVLCWYVDSYYNTQKLMAISLAKDRTTAQWAEQQDVIAGLAAVTGDDPNTAKYNTTRILMASYATPAASHCRSVAIGGVACNLPNYQQCRTITKLESVEIIDSLDSSSGTKLSTIYDSFEWSWTSTQFNARQAAVSRQGGSASGNKPNVYHVLPILELDPVTLEPIA